MKHSLYIASALLALAGFTACDDDFATPPTSIPTLPAGIVANTSIEDFKAAYWSNDRNSAVEIGQNEDGQDIIIAGRIVSSDESGNIYKNLIIQDLETGEGLTIGVDSSTIYKTWQTGQKIYINVTGMYAGMYNNLFQLGGLGTYNNAPSMTFAETATFKAHSWLDGLAEPEKIDTTVVRLADLRDANNDVDQRRQLMSRLVRLDSVMWDGGGKLTFAEPYSTSSATNRYIKDAEGNRLIVRNSGRSDFYNDTLPKGFGSVTGILSYYGTDGWQLLLNDKSGVDFEDWSVDTPIDPSTLEANISIADFKAAYWSNDRNSATLIGKNKDGEDLVIKGRIVSSDATGNIYKNLIIQDETGESLTIGVNQTKLYTQYPQGQELLIKVSGMYAGMYNNLFQLGGLGSYNNAPSMTFADFSVFSENCIKIGTPDTAAIIYKTVTISELNEANSNIEKRRTYMSRIVTIENVSWQGGGSLTYATSGQSENRYLIDADGNKILVHNSSYSSFFNETLPTGTGSVTAILSYYGTDGWQLLLNSSDDCKGFK